MTRVVGAVLLTATLLLCLEAGSYFFLRAARAKNPLLFRVTARELAAQVLPTLPVFLRCEAWVCPHATLGWWHQPGTRGNVGFGSVTADEVGSRVVPNASGPVLVSSYGDSFTQGIEVDDASTWQAHLARLSGVRVQNFGMIGYGPDQALLYLQHNLGRGDRVPIVVLGVIAESLNRLMNAFRPFYTYPTFDIPLGFKPVLVKSRGRYEFRIFAPARPLDRAELEAAIAQAGAFDAFHRLRTESVSFPFSVRAAGYLRRHGLTPRFSWPSKDPEAYERMAFILEELWRASRVHRFIPVLLVMPMDERQLRQPAGRSLRSLQPALERLGAEAARDIVLVDVAAELHRALAGPGTIEEHRPYLVRTHPSTHGYRLIATVLRRRLCTEPRIQADPELANGLCRG